MEKNTTSINFDHILSQDPRKFKKSLIKKFERSFEPEVSEANLITCFYGQSEVSSSEQSPPKE